MSAAINQETLIWTGPCGQQAVTQDFLRIFGQSVQLEADDLRGCCRQEEHDELLSDLARKRGLFCPVSTLKDLPRDSLMCPSSARHYHAYKRIMETFPDKVGAVSGSFVVDLSQNPDTRPRYGAWFPAFAKSSRMYSMSRDDFFANAELDFAMGFPTADIDECAPFQKSLHIKPHMLPNSQYCMLAGNGMHVAAMAAWWSYIFAHCVRKSDVMRIEWPLLTSALAEEEQGRTLACVGHETNTS